MSLKKWLKKANKKYITTPWNKMNESLGLKQPKLGGDTPAGSALVKRMKKRQGGEGYLQAQVEELQNQ